MLPARNPSDGASRPESGDTLLVIHDFQARSSDELSLKKGDRVELLERDDEFGDGWFLGRHLVNNNTGLFPEVYTRPAPKVAANSTPSFNASQPLTPLVEVSHELPVVGGAEAPAAEEQRTASPKASTIPPEQGESSVTPAVSSIRAESTPTSGLSTKSSPAPTLGQLTNPSQDSQVLNDTLNVINEHITHLRSPPSGSILNAPATDSGSEYSAPIDHRMSYIQGEETDEEEDAVHTRPEVETWTPDDVAEYLFTVGVEKHHCEVFRDQEISGEVILGMDQSSLFIKAFDLGSVGRRLKTWQKIKSLQDEVSSRGLVTRRTTQTYGSDVGSEDARQTRSRTSTLTGNSMSRPTSVSTRRLSLAQSSKTPPTSLASPVPQNQHDTSSRPPHVKRPSAASVRDLHYSRRHSSSTDFRMTGASANVATPKLPVSSVLPGANEVHKKQPSFDRNWTLGSAFSQTPPRPLSSAGMQDILGASEPDLQDSAVDLDRGYFSGTEVDGRRRNVLRKRDSVDQTKKQSYAEEQRVRSATALSRHSRYGSVDSFRDGAPPTAAQKYYGPQSASHKRTASTNTTESAAPPPPAKDGPAPTVTKLDIVTSPVQLEVSPSLPKPPVFRSGMRAISDKLTFERSKSRSSADMSPRDISLPSPAPTGSSTPSGGPSLDLESPTAVKSPNSATAPASKNNRKKSKKETSAYTRGLLKIPPKEAMKDADYYGWMKKKSSNLMTTWKPRLFVLKGRRLAYYYSESDDQEKGLIDISFHRVLPADNEKLTGLHATITGAGGQNMSTVGDDNSQPIAKGDDVMFIFKLVPPRTGLSKAVNFTKPTVHYFAVQNLRQGRLWMAALMKATIERDDTQAITTTYQQKTISLAKAKQMRHRPPALMNLEEAAEDEKKQNQTGNGKTAPVDGETDSGVSGVDKLASAKTESARLDVSFSEKDGTLPPLSA